VRLTEAGVQVELLDPPAAGDAVVALWVDGWLVEERPASGQDAVSLTVAAGWSSGPPRELMVRVRGEEGPWGPPYRLLFGDDDPSGQPDAGALEGALMLHLPQRGEFLVTSNDGTSSLSAPIRLLTHDSPAALSVAGSSQAWLSEGARDLDVYF
jgi:hypothetical protein